jgi:translation elongation factor EF-G
MIDELRDVFNEAVAGTDDELMEKYFEGEELTKADKIKGLTLGLAEGTIVPVFAASGLTGVGVDLLLDFIKEGRLSITPFRIKAYSVGFFYIRSDQFIIQSLSITLPSQIIKIIILRNI